MSLKYPLYSSCQTIYRIFWILKQYRQYCTSHTYQVLFTVCAPGPSWVGLMYACEYRCLYVCIRSQEKSTAGVTLISGVILSFSPQGHVAEANKAVTLQTTQCIHAKPKRIDWEMEAVSVESKPISFSHPTPLILPHLFLFSILSRIISAVIAASPSICPSSARWIQLENWKRRWISQSSSFASLPTAFGIVHSNLTPGKRIAARHAHSPTNTCAHKQ